MSEGLPALIIAFVVSSIAAFLLALWTVRHGYWMYLDLWTEDRRSVSHRRQVPERTFIYKCVNLFTFFAMFCSTLVAWSFVIGWIASDLTTCRIAMLLNPAAGFPGKFFVYLVYITRLHLVYHGSKYAKNPIILKSIGVIIGAVFSFVMIFQSINAFAATDEDGDEDSQDDVMTYTNDDFIEDDWSWSVQFGDAASIYNVCNMLVPTLYVSIYALVDITANLGFSIAFIRPIRDVIRKVQGSTRNIQDQSKMSRKMLFVGFKVALLSVVLFVSTIFTVLVYAATGINVIALDSLINAICISLMTAYYPDSKYYQKLCKCCIACCDKKGYTTGKIDDLVPETSPRNNEPTVTDMVGSNRSDASSLGNKSATGPSADTMSAIRIAAKEENPLKSDTNDTETELAAHLNEK